MQEALYVSNPPFNEYICGCGLNCLFIIRWSDRSEQLWGATRDILLYELGLARFEHSTEDLSLSTAAEKEFFASLWQFYQQVLFYEDPALQVKN
jgi:hypothetical protein